MTLFEGILAQAREAAQEIQSNCLSEITQLQQEYQRRALEAEEAEGRLLTLQMRELERRQETQIRSIERKKSLLVGKNLKEKIYLELAREMENLLGSSDYQGILVGWMAEAAIGVDRERVKVQCSFKEEITPEMLKQAEELIKKCSGKSIQLELDPKALSSQGVVVSSLDGKISYDNRVETRMERYGRIIGVLMEGEHAR